MSGKRLFILLLVMVAVSGVGAALSLAPPTHANAAECPSPTPMTAPSVGPWSRVIHGPTYEHIDVHFTLSDQYGDPESPLYLYKAADGIWRTTVDFDYQVTPCIDQYKQLVEFSLGVLNDGERPFTWDNHETIADYEAFLMGVHGWRIYLPLVGKDSG